MGRGRSPWWKEEEGKWKKSEKKRLSEGRREWNVRGRWRGTREGGGKSEKKKKLHHQLLKNYFISNEILTLQT